MNEDLANEFGSLSTDRLLTNLRARSYYNDKLAWLLCRRLEESLNNEMDLKSANANLELDIEDLKFENRGLMALNRKLMSEMAI